MNVKSILKFLMCCCFLLPIYAQDEDMDSLLNMSLEELLNMEVTSASKFAQNIRFAPSVISVTGKEQLDLQGWTSLNEILYTQPGFGPGQDFDRPTVPTRGLFDSWSNNHILHLVDGIPMNDNLYGSAYTWDMTPIVNAQSIEIIRGPGSALYGSNATNGVVQVNTVSAWDLDKKVDIRARSGSANTQVYDVLAAHDGENFGMVVSYTGRNTDGNEYLTYDGSARLDDQGNLAQFKTRDQRESSYLWAKIEGKNKLEGLSFQYHEQDWDFQTGHGWLWWVPDFEEEMNEQRRIFSVKYQPAQNGKLSQEYVLRYQRHDVTWNQRYYPDDAFGGYYPSGMWEYLETDAEDVFVRIQFGYQMKKGANLLMGFEGDRFIYKGDTEHYSNVNVDSGYFEPFPGDRNTALGPWLDFILNEPLINTGFYTQFSSGELLGKKLQMTLGVRLDDLSFDFHRIYDEGRPKDKKSFSRVSPRLAFVYSPNDKSTYKLMGGKAFRAPTPTELAGAHTFSLASNIDELQPELITTVEMMGDWLLGKHFHMKANIFQTEFENQIAYSTANNNLSTNVFSQTSQGLELELLYKRSKWSGYVNASFVERADEEVLDTTITQDPDNVTWEPSEKINLGLAYSSKKWNMALEGHYHGSVSRRPSDIGEQELPLGVGVVLNMDLYRPETLGSWFSANGKFDYQFTKSFSAGLKVENLFDEEVSLAKSGPFPFDYKGAGRKMDFFLRLKF